VTRAQKTDLGALALLILLQGYVTGWAWSLPIALLALASLRLRLKVSRPGEGALAAVLAGLSWLLHALLFSGSAGREALDLLPGIAGFSFFALLWLGLRGSFRDPYLGHRGNAILGLLALFGLGNVQVGPVYPAVVACWAILTTSSLRAEAGALPKLFALPKRTRRMTVLALVIWIAVAGAFAAILPPAHDRALGMLGLFGRGQSGFGTQLSLGGATNIRRSRRAVLRVRGEGADYLRGVVYSRYKRGRWRVMSDGPPADRSLSELETTSSQGLVVVETIGGDRRRYFVPAGARALAVPAGIARIDGNGLVFPERMVNASRLGFRPGSASRGELGDAVPLDLEVPPEIQASLERFLVEAGVGESGTPLERVASIAEVLRQGFAYTLDRDQSPSGVDPVVDFLERSRRGHCEYFATALALLARSRQVPARVVGGYRVLERNEIGQYYLVRDEHAHAWVEVHDDHRGWVTFDATPPGSLEQLASTRTPFASALGDYVGASIAEGFRRLMSIGPGPLALLAGLLLAAWLGIPRLVRYLLARGQRLPGPRRGGLDYDEPLPCLETLLDGLSRRGFVVLPTEPLERLASRVAEEGGQRDWQLEGAALLSRYSALRFGGHGSARELDADIGAWTRKIRAS